MFDTVFLYKQRFLGDPFLYYYSGVGSLTNLLASSKVETVTETVITVLYVP